MSVAKNIQNVEKHECWDIKRFLGAVAGAATPQSPYTTAGRRVKTE